MIHTLPPFMHEVEEAIESVESRSAAELVVAIAPWSGNYRDADLTAGIGLGLLGLIVILFAPFEIDPIWVVPEVILFGLAGWFASRRLARVRRWLTPRARRHAQVTAEASRAFHEEEVSATRDRSGLLLFVSLGEEEVRIVPDHGVLARVPAAEWKRLEAELTPALSKQEWIAKLAATIRAAGELLEKSFPVREDDVNELSNSVRIRV